jgi:hypothetical protein
MINESNMTPYVKIISIAPGRDESGISDWSDLELLGSLYRELYLITIWEQNLLLLFVQLIILISKCIIYFLTRVHRDSNPACIRALLT